MEKEGKLLVATEKEFLAKPNNSFLTFFYLWLLIGSLILVVCSFSKVPKVTSFVEEIVLEKTQETWLKE